MQSVRHKKQDGNEIWAVDMIWAGLSRVIVNWVGPTHYSVSQMTEKSKIWVIMKWSCGELFLSRVGVPELVGHSSIRIGSGPKRLLVAVSTLSCGGTWLAPRYLSIIADHPTTSSLWSESIDDVLNTKLGIDGTRFWISCLTYTYVDNIYNHISYSMHAQSHRYTQQEICYIVINREMYILRGPLDD